MIHSYMILKRFPKHLRLRVHRYFRRYFEQRTALNESAILTDLNPALREEARATALAPPAAHAESRGRARARAAGLRLFDERGGAA